MTLTIAPEEVAMSMTITDTPLEPPRPPSTAPQR
jgi:hypothetical protein